MNYELGIAHVANCARLRTLHFDFRLPLHEDLLSQRDRAAEDRSRREGSNSDAVLARAREAVGGRQGRAQAGQQARAGQASRLPTQRCCFRRAATSTFSSQAEIKESFPNVKADIAGVAHGVYLLELVNSFVDQRQPNPDIFDTLLSAMYVLESGTDPEIDRALLRDPASLDPGLRAALRRVPEMRTRAGAGEGLIQPVDGRDRRARNAGVLRRTQSRFRQPSRPT